MTLDDVTDLTPMTFTDILLPEFDHEMAVTRRVLERVPLAADADWQPHAKSMSLARLASHLADIPGWVSAILRHDGYDMRGEDDGPEVVFRDRDALLAHFDARARAGRDLLATASDAEMLLPWTLKKDGHVVLTMPRAASLRSFLFSHLIHHRGQLSVYLRLRDVPVPSIYGPSADER
ncbi:MAG: damage-inducible protein DinB [Vicinamibacteraceae bacterium]|nr:damage-inducible protein DinB [Vicinamibacteraceae bacterium]